MFIEVLEELAEFAVRFEIIVVVVHPGENDTSDVFAQGEVGVLVEHVE